MVIVTTEYTGSGDPQRSLELMWGVEPPPRRGPKPKLTAERIATTAIELADAVGLGALSMRRIAEELAVSTMSIYTYVPGKAELIDLMLDRVTGELVPPPQDAPWRAALEHIAHQNWDLYHRHPWLLEISTGRPPLGPNLLDKYEYELRAVEGLGLTDVEMDSVVALVDGHAASTARTSVHVAQAPQRTGMTEQEWWDKTGPVLARLIDPDAYPLGNRVGTASSIEYQGAVGPRHAFDFGLARILDGIEVLISSR